MRFDAQVVAMTVRAVVAVLLLLFACGCAFAPTRVPDSLTKDLGGSDPDAQMEFWHQLAQKPLTSNDEAFHGLLLYMGGGEDATTYDQRVASLRSRNMLPK